MPDAWADRPSTRDDEKEDLPTLQDKSMHRMETTFAGRPLILETGRMAKQAHGACLITYGETVALCTVTAQDRPTHLPFFPLTVEYRERMYAAGKIPGGFFKRESRPGEGE